MEYQFPMVEAGRRSSQHSLEAEAEAVPEGEPRAWHNYFLGLLGR